MPETLRDWLDTLDSPALEHLLAGHPLILRGAPVRDLDDLATRLAHPATTSQALMASPAPLLQLVETASALGAGATTDRLAQLLDSGGADAQQHRAHLDYWIDEAAGFGLAWRDGDLVRTNPGLDQVIIGPLALARPARAILDDLTVDQLRAVLRAWGVKAPTRKAEMLAAVHRVISDPAALRRIAADAPDDVLASLTAHVSARLAAAQTVTAAEDEVDLDEEYGYDPDDYAAQNALWQWATGAGLAYGYSMWAVAANVEMPTEVYLALAPPDFRLGFDAGAPLVATTSVPAERIGQASAGALTEFLGTAMAILESAGRRPLKANKSGGVGARELARFAKELGTSVGTVRLALSLADQIGLIAEPGQQVTTAEEFDSWRRLPPARRAAELLEAWLPLTVAPTRERDDDGSYLPLFGKVPADSQLPVGLVLARLLSAFGGSGVVAVEELAALVAWYHPMVAPPAETIATFWAEGHQLGLFVDGAPAPVAGLIASGDLAATTDLLTQALPAPSTEVMFGSDLTIVVPGSPDPEAVDLLDALARREGHGVAGTWRVSTDSVRDALDSGYAVDDLVGALRTLADRPLPQALEYLLRDVGRKHGHLQVRPAATVLTSTDEPLLAEVVAARGLRALSLTLVAPTVATSARSPEQVLSALRKAGYLPVEVDDGGSPVVALRRVPGSVTPAGDAAPGEDATPGGNRAPDRAVAPDADDESLDGAELRAAMEEFLAEMTGRPAPVPAEPEPPAAAARRLVAGDAPPAGHTDADLEHRITATARHLTSAEARDLADAVTTGRAVFLHYRSTSGNVSARVVSGLSVQGPYLFGYCHSREGDRQFRLDRILAVAPAG